MYWYSFKIGIAVYQNKFLNTLFLLFNEFLLNFYNIFWAFSGKKEYTIQDSNDVVLRHTTSEIIVQKLKWSPAQNTNSNGQIRLWF